LKLYEGFRDPKKFRNKKKAEYRTFIAVSANQNQNDKIYFPWFLVLQVEIPNGKYAGQRFIKPVISGTMPINPHQL